MKVVYVGASVRDGTSVKTGRPYTIGEVAIAVRDKPGQKKAADGSLEWDYSCHGHRIQTLPLNPDVLGEFASIEPHKLIDLKLEPQPENPARNWVVGVAK